MTLLHEKKQLDSPKQKRSEATHMTKLRKLTALLLAGALTLLLLTACSGGGGSSGPEAQAEAKVMRAIRSNPSTASLAYDDEMRDIAKRDRSGLLYLQSDGDVGLPLMDLGCYAYLGPTASLIKVQAGSITVVSDVFDEFFQLGALIIVLGDKGLVG